MDGTMTPQEIVRNYLVLITCQGDEPTNENTTIDPELTELIIEDIRKGDIIPRPCYFDSENNVIRNGINFREP